MNILSRILFLLFVLAGILLAVSNRQPVELSLWPLPHQVVMPVYMLVIGVLLLGVLAGLGLGWWGGRHHRRRARHASGEAARLGREMQRLRDAEPVSPRPAAPAAAPPVTPSGQRAIERQSLLVAPQMSPPGTRGAR